MKLWNGEDPLEAGQNAMLVHVGMTSFNKPVLITYIGDGVGCFKLLSNNLEYTFAESETTFRSIKNPKKLAECFIDSISQTEEARSACYDLLNKLLENNMIKRSVV